MHRLENDLQRKYWHYFESIDAILHFPPHVEERGFERERKCSDGLSENKVLCRRRQEALGTLKLSLDNPVSQRTACTVLKTHFRELQTVKMVGGSPSCSSFHKSLRLPKNSLNVVKEITRVYKFGLWFVRLAPDAFWWASHNLARQCHAERKELDSSAVEAWTWIFFLSLSLRKTARNLLRVYRSHDLLVRVSTEPRPRDEGGLSC